MTDETGPIDAEEEQVGAPSSPPGRSRGIIAASLGVLLVLEAISLTRVLVTRPAVSPLPTTAAPAASPAAYPSSKTSPHPLATPLASPLPSAAPR